MKIGLNIVALASAASSVGVGDSDGLSAYLGMNVMQAPTMELIATIGARLPVEVGSAMRVLAPRAAGCPVGCVVRASLAA